jgi:hypothetical protein
MGMLHWPRNILYLKKLALTSPTSGSRSVSIVRSRTKATEFQFLLVKSCAFKNLLRLTTSITINIYYSIVEKNMHNIYSITLIRLPEVLNLNILMWEPQVLYITFIQHKTITGNIGREKLT